MKEETKTRYRYEVAPVGDKNWGSNQVSYATWKEAKEGAEELLSRWMGVDMARVVTADTPRSQPIDPDDPFIVVDKRGDPKRGGITILTGEEAIRSLEAVCRGKELEEE